LPSYDCSALPVLVLGQLTWGCTSVVTSVDLKMDE
jgi:hypothetical protein